MPKSSPAAIATQNFSTTPERVYEAFLDPGMIARFMFGPLLREEEIIAINIDARVGGEFSYKVRRAGVEIDHVGTFLALDRPGHLRFTWAVAPERDGSTVTVNISPTPEGCGATLIHELAPGWEDYVERVQASWEKMLGVLARVL
jgi:uncharacterized protein YndB with AHSA1/START domain